MYADGIDAHGKQIAQASQDTNAAAIAYGVVPPSRVAAIGAYVAGLGMQAPPMTAGEVLEALRLAGRDADVLTRLTDATTDGWARILAEGATFTWEVWRPSDANGDSMSHGWGSNVAVEIVRGVLGVWPTSPGYATFAVSPPQHGVTSASAHLPTPRGTVVGSWRRSAVWTLDLTVPADATATVTLPAAGLHHVVWKGPGVRVVSAAGGLVVLSVGSGTYAFHTTV